MRSRAVFDLLESADRIPASELAGLTADFDARRQLFWSGNHEPPGVLRVVNVPADGGEGVVVTFDAREPRGL